METVTNKKKNYYGLDLARWVFAICIIMIHTGPHTPGGIVGRILQEAMELACVVFFIISGFLLFSGLNPDNEIQSLNKYTGRMFRRYCVWNAIYLPLTIYAYVVWDTGIIKGVLIYIKDFIFFGGHDYSRHFWYILSSAYAGLVIAFLRKRRFSAEIIAILGMVSFLLAIGFDYIRHYGINSQISVLITIEKLIALTIRDGKLFTGFFYLSLMMLVVKYWDKLSKLAIWVIFAGAFGILGIKDSYALSMAKEALLALTAVFLCMGLSRINLPDAPVYRLLRRSSALMYYSHNIFVFIWGKVIVKNAEYRGNGCFLFALAGTILVSVVFNLLYEKKRYFWLEWLL